MLEFSSLDSDSHEVVDIIDGCTCVHQIIVKNIERKGVSREMN